ncbi:hypothetical protein [Thiomicrospira microaerophila]|uniref:hypothetical protein n=1 Tax=Thiomicrospira microaerophila TaxID=406020 RepID=UPI0005CA416C|nr:hypothetical protein [Thiomicrospira microaerophila]
MRSILIKPLVFFISATVLSGCSSTLSKTEIAKEEAQIQLMQAKAQQEREKQENKRMQQVLSDVPDWVLNPPRADDLGFYGVGIGKDADLMNATRKARLQASFEIANTMRAELSGEDTMNQGDYRFVVNRFVDKVNISGAEVVRQEVKPVQGEFQSYVLMRFNYAQFDALMAKQAEPDERQSLEFAYQRLMQKVGRGDTRATPAP